MSDYYSYGISTGSGYSDRRRSFSGFISRRSAVSDRRKSVPDTRSLDHADAVGFPGCSQYLTGVTITLISYGIIILACLLFSVIYKIKADIFPSAEFAEINYPNINKFSPIIYFLPLAALLTNSIWQMTLEIMTDSIWAFFFVLVLNIISCYFAANYLPGNGAMLIRSRIGEENINEKF